MARSNATTKACYKATKGISQEEAKLIGDRADDYSTGDIAADWASATQDLIEEYMVRYNAIEKAVQEAEGTKFSKGGASGEKKTSKQQSDDQLSKMSGAPVSRRSVLVAAMAAAAGGNANAGDVSLGKAKALSSAVSQQMPSSIAKILRGNGKTNPDGAGAVRSALEEIAANGPAEVRPLAKLMIGLLPKSGFFLTVDDNGLWNAHGAVRMQPIPHLMLFTAEGRTGLTYETFLHETLHMIVAAKYSAISRGGIQSNYAKIKVGDPAAMPELKQFIDVWREFKDAVKLNEITDKDLRLAVSEALSNPDEFFVRALTEPRFQQHLSSMEYKGKTLLQRFVDWVKESLFGFKKEGTVPSWLDAALMASNDLLNASGKDPSNFKVAGAFSDAVSKNSLKEETQFSKVAADAEYEDNLKKAREGYEANVPESKPPAVMNKMVEVLPEAWRPAAFKIAQVLTGKTGDAINAVAFTEDLIDRAKSLGIKAAELYRAAVRQQSAIMGAHERTVQDIAAQYMGIEEENKGVGAGTANQFLHDSTMSRKWGYVPDHLKAEGITPDPEMEKAFKALKPKAQEYVKAVFAHGYATLEAKKKAVLDSVPSIYDALIAAETDPEAKQKLIDEKADTIKQFGSMYRLDGNTPYSPLKRFGKYVVSARSRDLIAMQQLYDKTPDGAERVKLRKQIRQMEADAKHQFVDFVDNEYEARAVEEKLRQQGIYEDPQTRERNEASLYSGSGTLGALRGIEAKLNDEPDGKHKRAMLKLVSDMYLNALAEDSARRNEMERVGVKADNADGTTHIDMQRAFESQGKADAFFLAHAATGRAMQDAFRQMKTESNSGGDTRAKSSLYNELMLRRIQSLNYDGGNWSKKSVRMASKWMLAFSPAYYMQNATQPWMVSLPVMAGRHDMTKAGSVLASKYSQIAQAVKEADLFGNLNYNKILDGIKDPGERAFLKRALDEGIIDIGHGIELGENSHYDSKTSRGWDKVDRSIRNLQQKAEAINRITTALTAYELEKGKTNDAKAAEDYAERIVRETHGDYSAWNAPRAFNTNLGRVALQFRKYQLVQLTLMARLLRNSFANADPKERAMARKAFSLMLGQAFLVGGAKALPMTAVVPAVMSMAFGHGGDEPPEYLFRRWVGDKDIADLLLNGMPSILTGLNLTKFGGMGNALDILPFQNGLLPTDRTSMESFGFGVLTGPAGGLALRAADGFANITNGMWWKGIESLVPTGFTNLSKGARYMVQGDENKRGTLNLGSEEFNAFTAAAQALGIQPGVAERRMYEQQAKYDIENAFKDSANRLKAEYVRATRSGDTDAMADVREKWGKMQEGQRADGIQPSPLSILMKAPQEARKSDQNRIGTQVYGKKDKELGSQLSSH